MQNFLLLGRSARRDADGAAVAAAEAGAVAAVGAGAVPPSTRTGIGSLAQSHVLFLERIEVSEELRRDLVFAFIRAQDGFELFRAADPDVVILLEIGRGRIFVPAALIFEGRAP